MLIPLTDPEHPLAKQMIQFIGAHSHLPKPAETASIDATPAVDATDDDVWAQRGRTFRTRLRAPVDGPRRRPRRSSAEPHTSRPYPSSSPMTGRRDDLTRRPVHSVPRSETQLHDRARRAAASASPSPSPTSPSSSSSGPSGAGRSCSCTSPRTRSVPSGPRRSGSRSGQPSCWRSSDAGRGRSPARTSWRSRSRAPRSRPSRSRSSRSRSLTLPVGFGAILNASTPLFTALLGVIWLGDRLSARMLLGLGIGIAAVIVLVGWSPLEPDLATLVAVLAALGAALGYAFGGHVRQATTPRRGRHGTGDRPAHGRRDRPAAVRARHRSARTGVTHGRRWRCSRPGRCRRHSPGRSTCDSCARRPRPSRAPSRSSCPRSRSPGARSSWASRSVRS